MSKFKVQFSCSAESLSRTALHMLFGASLAMTSVSALADERSTKPLEMNKHTSDNLNMLREGAAGNTYPRRAPANYADGVGEPVDGPNPRRVSNRIFADRAQNLFSETGVTQWVWTWGQFIDHSIGLRRQSDDMLYVQYDGNDPMELFSNADSTTLRMTRSAVAEDSGVTQHAPRDQINDVRSNLDAWAVYGGSVERLEWMREGPVDGDLRNNGARLLLTDDGFLPPASIRGDALNAPTMEREGLLRGAPDADDIAVVAGDVRANENVALTAVQTLFAREHNRIVDRLPREWTEQRRFDVARLLVTATQQYITYTEFLPALGIELPPASQYQPNVDVAISNEFATVGYRAHSMIHGEIETTADADYYDAGQLDKFRAQGVAVSIGSSDENNGPATVELAVPLNVAFGNPQLVRSMGVGRIAIGLAAEPQYRNDEQIDNQLRSVLFQLPSENSEDPHMCLDGPRLPECFTLIADIGVLDIVRGRDHGMPYYNDMRAAYGLTRIGSFTELTGEATESFPTDDPLLNTRTPIDDPASLDFVMLFDAEGAPIDVGSEAADTDAVEGIRRTTLAARLKGLYPDIDTLDAFVGMVSEPHLPNSDLGELQHAMWTQQFTALRDGDPNFYLWNRDLLKVERELAALGLSWRQSLADVVIATTDGTIDEIRQNLFIDADSDR